MKVLHVTPHLGAGIGKALSSLNKCLPRDKVQQTFLLLEKPIKKQFVNAIVGNGGTVWLAESLQHVAQLAADHDIVQFEFINHPRMLECLAKTEFPPIRSSIWAHISGLFKPYIQPGLITQAQRFTFSSKISLNSPTMEKLDADAKKKVSVISSGFGFPTDIHCVQAEKKKVTIAYLGTVNFVKMHKGFFTAIDMLQMDVSVDIWGAADKAVLRFANTMRNKERFKFHGETYTPVQALAAADIFFYPLQRTHYGTGENALVEAMSLGLPAVVMNNPAEEEIIKHLDTGFIATTVDDCNKYLSNLVKGRGLRDFIGRSASKYVRTHKSPMWAAADFMDQWRSLLTEAPRVPDFGAAIGRTPFEWYQSTQQIEGVKDTLQQTEQTATKGSLAHFKKVFASDPSFKELGVEYASKTA